MQIQLSLSLFCYCRETKGSEIQPYFSILRRNKVGVWFLYNIQCALKLQNDKEFCHCVSVIHTIPLPSLNLEWKSFTIWKEGLNTTSKQSLGRAFHGFAYHFVFLCRLVRHTNTYRPHHYCKPHLWLCDTCGSSLLLLMCFLSARFSEWLIISRGYVCVVCIFTPVSVKTWGYTPEKHKNASFVCLWSWNEIRQSMYIFIICNYIFCLLLKYHIE